MKPTKLKEVEIKKVEGEEQIVNSDYGFGGPQNMYGSKYFNAKHTYIKCNACGERFSLNYPDKSFKEAKLAALAAK
jgi:hypothetical protein